VQNQYGLYFQKGNTVARLPANPEEYTIESPTGNTRYNVLDLGEIIIPRIPNLKSISLESYFPGDPEDPFALGGFKTPEYYIDFFENCQKERLPVRFIANRIGENGRPIFDTNIEVIVEKFDVIEKGGETGDFYYSVSLSQYRSFEPKTVTIQKSPATTTAVTTTQRATSNDVINVGDTVIANGKYWYSSWGNNPFGTANNLKIQVTRIVQNPNVASGQVYPYHIGQRGWLKKDQLRKV